MKNYEKIVNLLKKQGYKIATMEGFTSGLLLSSITDSKNAIDVTEGGYIAYSNQSIIDYGVKREVIEDYGYYSVEAAIAMAKACKENKKTQIGIGITGILRGKYKDSIDIEEGVSPIELTSNGPITAVYVAIDSPLGIEHYTIEVPTMFKKNKYKSLIHYQKSHIVELVLDILETTLNKESSIREGIQNDDYDDDDEKYDCIGFFEAFKEKKTVRNVSTVVGFVALGVAITMKLKSKLKK